MGASGRPKGCAAEREVAGLLERWWRQLEPECRFVRTPSSGGWHGRSGADIRAGFKAGGDIMTTATKWPFCAEIKRREGWDLGRFLANRPSPVWGWWDQTCLAAAEQRAEPILWMRHNREPWRVVLTGDVADAIGLGGQALTRPSDGTLLWCCCFPERELLGANPRHVLGAIRKVERRRSDAESGK